MAAGRWLIFGIWCDHAISSFDLNKEIMLFFMERAHSLVEPSFVECLALNATRLQIFLIYFSVRV